MNNVYACLYTLAVQCTRNSEAKFTGVAHCLPLGEPMLRSALGRLEITLWIY